MASQKHICIIGNGIAGITAARNIRKLSDHKITVISSESKHFYSRTALMYIYMGHMKFEHTKPYEDWFWAKNRIDLVHDYVEKIDFSRNEIRLKASKSIFYDELILATGSKPNLFGWPGQDLEGVSGLYSIQDLENIEKSTQNITEAAIIGGGLIGIELAEMLVSRKIKVNFLVREKHFWANILPEQEGKLIEREISKHGVNLLLNNELESILGTSTSLSNQTSTSLSNQTSTSLSNQVNSIKTKKGEILNCQFVGLTVGVSPNISFLKNTDLKTEKGILVDEFLKTNMPNVYAIGDCIEHKNPPFGRKSIEQIWYTGKIMGETLAKTICGKPTKYEPGIFYNSAKFFDIEYSVYGNVPSILPATESTFYWVNEKENKCLRINYLSDSEEITGIHAFGIRLRASTCLGWIENKTNYKTVIQELENANFDPEFSKKYLTEIMKNQ